MVNASCFDSTLPWNDLVRRIKGKGGKLAYLLLLLLLLLLFGHSNNNNIIIINYYYYYLAIQLVGSQFPNQGLKLGLHR